MNKQERFRIKQVLAIMIFGWLLIIGFNYLIELPGSKADQVCPLPSAPEAVHGTVVLQPVLGNEVIDCSAQDIVIASDGELVVERYYTANGSRDGDGGAVLLVRNLTVEAGGKISATGNGYRPGESDNGTGNALPGIGLTGGSGGGYGGAGGEGVPDGINEPGEPGVIYGSQENPKLLGGAGSNTSNGGSGGNGGGSIELRVSEVLTIDGIIEANGLDGSISTDNSSSAGGGAGGSILIEAGSLAGDGSVQAKGGTSPDPIFFQGGGGGGGRIQMFCTTVNNYTGSVSVLGGSTLNSQDGQTGSILGPTCRPNAPIVLKQFKLNLTTEIPVAGATAEPSFYLAADLSDPDTYDLLFLDVEVRPINTAFSNVVTHSQSSMLINPQSCTGNGATCGRVDVIGLTRGVYYHWQARVRDNKGGYSPWVSFGENSENESDILLAGIANTIAISTGNNQTGVVNTNLAIPLTVRVTDSGGLPVPGYSVAWSVVNGANGGTLLNGLTTETNVDGEAINNYRLGKQAGNNINLIRASGSGLNGSPVEFIASATPGAIDHFSLDVPYVSLVNTAFSATIKAYDQYGNIKTDFIGDVNLVAVDPLDTNIDKSGSLNPSQVSFESGDLGIINKSVSYNVAESIKIKAFYDIAIGYSNAIAIVESIGSCPDADGIIDTDQSWVATPSNNGVFDCSGLNLIIMSNSTLTLQSYDSGDTNYSNDLGVTILADGLQIDNGSSIFASGLGYAQARGPGYTYRNGVSHGGYGWGGASTPYGDLFSPISLGSGGSGDGYGPGGAGGGAIRLDILGNFTHNGKIEADGADGRWAGSGGSIWISAGGAMSGSGVIEADGGNSANELPAAGGGRISIVYGSNSGFPLASSNLHAYGGTNGWSNGAYGGPGTVYIEDKSSDVSRSGLLLLDNRDINGNYAAAVAGTYQFKQIKATGYGHIEFMGNESILTFDNGSEMVGDNTKPVIKVSGTLMYTGEGTL
ncbi:MAG TPA: hypothetical protein PKU95_02875, partial [Candidatus Dojkabacteria bacterium]|nr:hypothetical protein [Candidatus Dojkabacteria bacterium]